MLDEAEEERPRLPGTCGGAPFDDFRDVDDLTAPLFEVLTSTGKYYWIPMERVELIEFHDPRGRATCSGGGPTWSFAAVPTAKSFFPRSMPARTPSPDDRIRLGRMTDWRGGDDAPGRKGWASGSSLWATRTSASWS